MIAIDIPGFGTLELTDLVCDYNGTLALDGRLLEGVGARLPRLTGCLRLHVVTGDTFGTARAALKGLSCDLVVLPPYDQAAAKARYV